MFDSKLIFLIQNLVLKDFRIRYRNMSLGVIWSVANPLLMMGILTFVFTHIFQNPNIHHFALFALCALVPFNFYSLAANAGSTSLLDNQTLITVSYTHLIDHLPAQVLIFEQPQRLGDKLSRTSRVRQKRGRATYLWHR